MKIKGNEKIHRRINFEKEVYDLEWSGIEGSSACFVNNSVRTHIGLREALGTQVECPNGHVHPT